MNLKPGRTHQLRLHSAYIEHPILGDTLYSIPSSLITHQALHAFRVSFIHPITKKNMVILDNNLYDMENMIQKFPR